MVKIDADFTGWKALVVAVVVIAIIGIRSMTLNDMTGDEALMRQIDVQLMCDYYPDLTARLRAALESGDKVSIDKVAESVTTTKPRVDSVQASYPIFKFTSPKDVVIKVTYSLVDSSGTMERRIRYYLFSQGLFGTIWSYQYETTSWSYYLNFM